MLVSKKKLQEALTKLDKKEEELKKLRNEFDACKEANGKLRGILDNVVEVVIVWKNKKIGNLRAISTLKEYLLDKAGEK